MDNINRPPRPPNHHPALSKTTFLATTADIAPARDELEAWLHARTPELPAIRIYEIVLAANELLCNAFDHGDAASGCILDMRRVGNELVLTVSNKAVNASLLPLEWWTMPGADNQRGRGLAIIKTVADSVMVKVTQDSISITVTFDLLDRTTAERALAAKLAL